MKSLFKLTLLSLIIFSFISCKKDEPEVEDPRDQIIGTYSITYTYETNDGRSGSSKGTVIIEKENEKDLRIKEIEGVETTTLKANAVIKLNNGVAFNFPFQIYTDSDNNNWKLNGQQTVTVTDGTKYDGGLLGGTLTYSYKSVVLKNNNYIIITVRGTKI